MYMKEIIIGVVVAIIGGVMLAVGAYIFNQNERIVKLETKQDIFKENFINKSLKRSPFVPEPKKFKTIETFEEPRNTNLHFIKDCRVLDLRSRVTVPDDKKNEKISPANWTRFSLVSKLSKDVKSLTYKFGTSGLDIHARCLTHDFELLKLNKPHYHGEYKINKTWLVKINIEKEKIKTPFIILAESTYFNAFSDEDGSWAATITYEDAVTDQTIFVILFPEDKPYKQIDLYSYKHRSKKKKVFKDSSINYPKDKRQVFYWQIDKPEPGNTYEVRWTW